MTRRGAFALRFLVLLILPLSAVGQQYSIYSTKLDNGLEVIAIENPIVPLVTVELDVRNGSYTEPPEYNGLSHLYEHMFFKANASIPNQEAYLARARELGMTWNGTTSEERVNYFFTLPKDSLRQGLEFMKAATLTPLFLQAELERERPVVTGEYDRNEANPFYYLFRDVNQKLWYKYYSRKNVLGERETILTADQKKMQTIKDRYYIPNNSALLVAGAVQHEQIFALAREYFGDWKKGADPFTLYPVPEHPPLTASSTVVVEKPVNAVTVMIALHGPSVTKDPGATYAADVLSYILQQKNSGFQKRLVESGLCAFANFQYQTLDHTGPIIIMAQMSADKFVAGEKQLLDELAHLTDPAYYTDEQLVNAKTALERNEMFGQERPSQFVHTVGYWWAVVGNLDYYLHYVENLRKVTRKDINDYVKKYIQSAPNVKGILVSPADRPKILPQ
ncbi:MAG: pitrilysin family protein [Bacteroidota bacterium]